MAKQLYKNGVEYQRRHFTQAKDTLVRLGLYHDLDGFGPLLRFDPRARTSAVKEFSEDGFLFMEFQYESVSLSLDGSSTHSAASKGILFMQEQ